MSHEIRTPITNILGFAEILGERVGNEDRQFAAYIESNGRRLLDTVTTILDFSKLTSGTFPMRPHRADLAAIARDAAERFRSQAAERGIQIVHDADGVEIPLVVDRSAVDTMLNHIVGNAIKFTPEGSVVVRAGTEEGYGWIEVEDTGIGIADEFIAELFSPFKQESEGDARTFEGTGLGLSICQRLMHLMQGRIEVSSRKGEGSAFTLYLPLQTEEEARRDRGPLSHADILDASERVQKRDAGEEASGGR